MVAGHSGCSMVTPIAPCSWCAMVVTGPTARPSRDLGHRHRVVGLRRVESVVCRCGDGQCRCGPGPFDLAGHGGQRMLDRLELAQRPAELHALAGVRDRHVGGRVERTDDLHAARPCAATDSSSPTPVHRRVSASAARSKASDRGVRRPGCGRRSTLASSIEDRDVQCVGGRAASTTVRRARPRHVGRRPCDPAVARLRVGDRDGQRPVSGTSIPALPREPAASTSVSASGTAPACRARP